VAQGVVEQDAHGARHGVGIAAAPARPGRRRDAELNAALDGAQLELGGDRAAQLGELDGLLAQRHRGVEAAEVEQLAGQRREPAQLAPCARDLALRIGLIERAVAQVVLQQLDRPLQRGQRRAQLVRGGRHERAPRGLLAAQLALHARQRPRQVADLVEPVVARGGGVGPLLGDADGGGAQAGEAPADGGGEEDAEQGSDREPDRRGGEEGVADLVDRLGDVGELLDRDEDERVVGLLSRDPPREDRAGDDDLVSGADGAPNALDERAKDLALGNGASGEVGVGDRRLAGDGVEDDHASVRAFAQRRRARVEIERLHPLLARRAALLGHRLPVALDLLLEEALVRGRRVLEVPRCLISEPLLQRRQQRERSHAERHGRREHQRGQQPRAQPIRPAPGHCSRKR
jgi:hypothetical protein